jgi:hypothetical protein
MKKMSLLCCTVCLFTYKRGTEKQPDYAIRQVKSNCVELTDKFRLATLSVHIYAGVTDETFGDNYDCEFGKMKVWR